MSAFEFRISGGQFAAKMDCNYNPPRLEVGCDMEYVNETLKNKSRSIYPVINQFEQMEDYYENYIEALITHEVIHLVIYRVEGEGSSLRLNEVDNNHEISGFPVGSEQ